MMGLGTDGYDPETGEAYGSVDSGILVPEGGSYGWGTIPSGSSGSSTNWGSFASSLANSFSSIFKTIQPLPSGCIQVAGPYGTSTQCGNQASQPILNMSGAASSLGMSSSTLLLLGGAVVVVIMMSKR